MAEKRLNARVSEEEFLAVKHSAETVGLTVAEFTRMAALNIGKQSATSEATAGAMAVILDRLDDLEARLGNPSPNGGRVFSDPPQDGPDLADIGEAMADLHADQKRTQSALVRTDETLQNLVVTVAKIFDHLTRQAGHSAPPAAPQPAANPTPPTPPAAPTAETFRRCRPGAAHQDWINSDEQPRSPREDFYRRNLRKFVDQVGWDSKVTPEQYSWAGMTPPDGLYDQ